MSTRFLKAAPLALVVGAVTVLSSCQDATAPASAPEMAPLSAMRVAASQNSRGERDLIADQYIVVLRDGEGDVEGKAKKLMSKTNGKISKTFKNGLKGFSARMTANEAAAVAKDPNVAYVEQDQLVSADDANASGSRTPTTGGSTKGGGKGGSGGTTAPGVVTQDNAPWSLDRVDQETLPLNRKYTYTATGTGVHVYIVDSGIRTTHVEFGGRATADFSAIDDGYGATGCNWHGTHVAGTVGGATVGVAKAARLHSVRVLDCNASGSWSQIIAGIDWVTANGIAPAVMNISISGGFSQAVNDAVSRAIAAGITVVVAAGNKTSDACSYSPASAPSGITVGGTGAADSNLAMSNFGACVDILAPGENVTSAFDSGDTHLEVASGTSMASPHVAGAAALYLQGNPSETPATVSAALLQLATPGRISSLGLGTPNLLLRTRL